MTLWSVPRIGAFFTGVALAAAAATRKHDHKTLGSPDGRLMPMPTDPADIWSGLSAHHLGGEELH